MGSLPMVDVDRTTAQSASPNRRCEIVLSGLPLRTRPSLETGELLGSKSCPHRSSPNVLEDGS
jgi:hypothetical protein